MGQRVEGGNFLHLQFLRLRESTEGVSAEGRVKEKRKEGKSEMVKEKELED